MKQVADLRARTLKSGTKRESETLMLDDALNACDDIVRDLAGAELECDRLRDTAKVEHAAWEQLFDAMPVAAVLTDCAGAIRHVNPTAAALLNVSAQHLSGRELIVFSENRQHFLDILLRLARGGDHVRITMAVRPRERKRVLVDVVITPASSGDSETWVWFLMLRPDSTEQLVQPRASGRKPRQQPELGTLPRHSSEND